MESKKKLFLGLGALGLGLGLFYFLRKGSSSGQKFDITKQEDALRLARKLKQCLYQYHTVLAVKTGMLVRQPGFTKDKKQIAEFALKDPDVKVFEESRIQKAGKYFGLEDLNLEQFRQTYSGDEEISQIFNEIDQQRDICLSGNPPSTSVINIPVEITIEQLQQIYLRIMEATLESLRDQKISMDEKGIMIHPQELVEIAISKIDQGDFKDQILEEYGLEDEEFEDCGEKILEAASAKFMNESAEFKDFLMEIQFQQLMGMEMVMANPKDDKKLQEFLNSQISQQQVQQAMMMMAMQMQGMGMPQGGAGGPPGGMPPGGLDQEALMQMMMGGGGAPGGPGMSEMGPGSQFDEQAFMQYMMAAQNAQGGAAPGGMPF